MANIELVTKYVPVLDELYKTATLSSVLDAQTQVDFSNGNAVKVMKVETTGLGDYSRQDGYAKGTASLTWETLTLSEDRSAELSVDRMDDEEALNMAFGAIAGEFTRVNVAPELDAYRFAKYAKAANIGTATGTLADGAAVVTALRACATAMDEAEVPAENRVLFITPTNYGLVEDLDTTKSREVLKRFSTIVQVPQTRFYSEITLNAGGDAWGYTKATGGKELNFLAVAKNAVVQTKKLVLPKIFDPDTNQLKDAWMFQYRLYHDAFVLENKSKGIYAHSKA